MRINTKVMALNRTIQKPSSGSRSQHSMDPLRRYAMSVYATSMVMAWQRMKYKPITTIKWLQTMAFLEASILWDVAITMA